MNKQPTDNLVVIVKFENYLYSDGTMITEGDRIMLKNVIDNTNQIAEDFKNFISKSKKD